MNKSIFVAIALVGSVAATASARQILISDIGGGVFLNAGPLSPTLFGNGQSVWTPASVAGIHATLNAGGISTNGRITFLAANSDHGLTLMALIDQSLLAGLPTMGQVQMNSIANGENLAYIMDGGAGIAISPNGLNARTASGNFLWNSNGGGSDFAWAGLEVGNTITFRFNRIFGVTLGLDDPGTFQFVNWNGSAWTQVSLPGLLDSFTPTDDYGFAATVVPAPGSLALAAMAVLPLARRRRTR